MGGVDEELQMPSLEGNPDPSLMVQSYVKALVTRTSKLSAAKQGLESIPPTNRSDQVVQLLGLNLS